MKRKLIFAGMMLVFALVAVVASTYAWFTMQAEADVMSMDLNVTSGEDLQISTNGDDFGYSVELEDINGLLNTVTLHNIDKTFKAIVNENSKYTYKDTQPFNPGDNTSNKEGGYLEYSIYLRANKDLKVGLDVSDDYTLATPGSNNESDLAAVRAIRIAFVVDGDYIIYEPNQDDESTYGTGEFFERNSGTPFIAFDKFLELKDNVYKFKENSPHSEYTTANDTVVDGILPVANLTTNDVQEVKVLIWLEGWDGDSTNIAQGATFNTYLKFKTYTE